MKSLEEHLREAAAFHGESCPGKTLGVRMARHGLALLGCGEPHAGLWRRRLMVFIETDRCVADAVMVVTGCRLGKRTLKFLDLGVTAATFLDVETATAIRVAAREEARALAVVYAPQVTDRYEQQRQAYRIMPDAELFAAEEVSVTVAPEDMPGPPTARVACQNCGEAVEDMRELNMYGAILCRTCAGESYFERLSPDSSGTDRFLLP